MLETLEACRKSYRWNREADRRAGDYAYARMRVGGKRPRRVERGYDIAKHFAQVIAARRRGDGSTTEQVFREQANLWWQETRILSSIQAKIFNPHYQRIIGMGRSVLPLIFSDLRDRGGHWYWALQCITGDNPAKDARTLPEAKRLWLEYAHRYKYL